MEITIEQRLKELKDEIEKETGENFHYQVKGLNTSFYKLTDGSKIDTLLIDVADVSLYRLLEFRNVNDMIEKNVLEKIFSYIEMDAKKEGGSKKLDIVDKV